MYDLKLCLLSVIFILHFICTLHFSCFPSVNLLRSKLFPFLFYQTYFSCCSFYFIVGEPEQCRAAVDLVLAKIAEDPQSAIYPAISYSHVRGPVASAYPTGSPFAIMPSVRFDTSQGSHLRLPPGRGASCGNIEGWDDNVPSGVGFSAVANPFGSSLFHAALLQVQAAALAANLNTTGYYPTLPSVDMAPTNMPTLFTHGLSTNIGYVPPEDATVLPPALPDYGQGFCPATPSGNVPLLGSGGGASGGGSNTGGGSGGHGSTLLQESIWPIGDSQIQTPTCFDAAYPGPLNFGWFLYTTLISLSFNRKQSLEIIGWGPITTFLLIRIMFHCQ